MSEKKTKEKTVRVRCLPIEEIRWVPPEGRKVTEGDIEKQTARLRAEAAGARRSRRLVVNGKPVEAGDVVEVSATCAAGLFARGDFVEAKDSPKPAAKASEEKREG